MRLSTGLLTAGLVVELLERRRRRRRRPAREVDVDEFVLRDDHGAQLTLRTALQLVEEVGELRVVAAHLARKGDHRGGNAS